MSEFDGISIDLINQYMDRIEKGEPSPFGEPQEDLLGFAKDIWEKYPALDSIEDDNDPRLKNSPWSCDFSTVDGYVYMCCRWGTSEDFIEDLNSLVNKHKLFLYDPQDSILYDNSPAE